VRWRVAGLLAICVSSSAIAADDGAIVISIEAGKMTSLQFAPNRHIEVAGAFFLS
jgi:hypothetical protein